jgi:hypothetical protein
VLHSSSTYIAEASYCETSINIGYTTRRHIPGDSNLRASAISMGQSFWRSGYYTIRPIIEYIYSFHSSQVPTTGLYCTEPAESMCCWRRMGKISWTYRVRNEEVLHRVKEERNILHTIYIRKANWIGHILYRNCFLKHVIEGKVEVTGKRRRRRNQLLDDFNPLKTKRICFM